MAHWITALTLIADNFGSIPSIHLKVYKDLELLDHDDLELTDYSCLCLLSAGIKAVGHHAQLRHHFNIHE